MSNKYGRFYYDIRGIHDEVTGSCIHCKITFPNGLTKNFIVDFGMYQEKKYLASNKNILFDIKEIDFVAVTHAHVDHIGRLPLLYKAGYNDKVLCSSKTAELLPFSLQDCSYVLGKNAKLNHEKPLYSEDNVQKMLNSTMGYQFNDTIQIDEYIKITFFENGHLYGASIILIQVEYCDETLNILFTGDYSSKNVFFSVAELPEWVKKLPINIVIESTYANMNTEDIVPCFEENFLKGIAEGKDIIIPAFSLGRGQEILYFIYNLQKQDKLNKNIAIYYTGNLGIRYTNEIFLNNESFFEEARNFIPENIIFVNKDNINKMFSDTKQKIIIGSSGMGKYGPMQSIIPYFLSKNALIHFTGYCAEDTLGRTLADSKSNSTVNISGIAVNKKAEVKFTNEFSAHAKCNELIEFLNKFKNLKLVTINHGSNDNKKVFSEKVIDEVKTKDIIILNKDMIFRVTAYGLQKIINTQFI